jgi:putative endonuclease
MREHQYYVYILTNRRGTLYTGVTNDLERRLTEHRAGKCGFTARYRIGKLIYFETTDDVWAAIGREKQIKGWLREKKFALIRTLKPTITRPIVGLCASTASGRDSRSY